MSFMADNPHGFTGISIPTNRMDKLAFPALTRMDLLAFPAGHETGQIWPGQPDLLTYLNTLSDRTESPLTHDLSQGHIIPVSALESKSRILNPTVRRLPG